MTPQPALTTIDPGLIGIWNNGGADLKRIDPSGGLTSLGLALPYTISVSGSRLSFPTTNPISIYTRITTEPSGLIGLWERFEQVGQHLAREEVIYRSNGTFTHHNSYDGVFDSEYSGTWVADGLALTSNIRLTRITTGPGNHMKFSNYFGPVFSGSYTIAPNGNSWSFTTGTQTWLFNRAP